MRLKRKASAMSTADAAASSISSSSSTLPKSSSASSVKSASSLSFRSLSGSISKMIDKAAASLKRRREPELYDHLMDTDSVLLAATEEVMRRSNADSRPAHIVAQHEGGWEEISVASSSAASSPYPQLPRLRAPLPTANALSPTSSAHTTTPAPGGSVRAIPPSISTNAFEAAMADLNSRLLTKGKSTTQLSQQPTTDGSLRLGLGLASSSGATAGRGTSDRFKAVHDKIFKKSDSIASHYATFRRVKAGPAGRVPASTAASRAKTSNLANAPSGPASGSGMPAAKRTKLNIQQARQCRSEVPSTPLSILAQPKYAPSSISRTPNLLNKLSTSTLKAKPSASTLRPKVSTSSLRQTGSKAEGPGSVRFGFQQTRTFTNQTSDESVTAEKGSDPASSTTQGSSPGPSEPGMLSKPLRRKATGRYIDVLATPPRLAPSGSSSSIPSADSFLKKLVPRGAGATLREIFTTPPRSEQGLDSAQRIRTEPRMRLSKPAVSSSRNHRFHPYQSPSVAARQGESKQRTTISPQGRTPNIAGARPVSRLSTGPAAARRPHIDRGRVMRRVRAAAEAGDEGMDVDAITNDLKPEDDRSTPPATVSPASLAPEFPAAPIQAPLPIFPTVPPQEPGKKPPHNDDAPSHAPNPQLVAVMTGEDTDGAETFASGAPGPCSTKSSSSLSSQRSAPVSHSSIMLTSSSSVPDHVTLSTGLAARLPSKARGAGKTGPQPLPPPPESRASSSHPSARASRSARALRANVHSIPKVAERRSEAGKRAIPSTEVTTKELDHGNSLASTAARRGRVALQIAQLNGQSASSSTDLLSKSTSVSLRPETSGSTFEGGNAPDAVEGNRRGRQAVKSVRASNKHKHASHDSANMKGEALGLGMPPAESGATGRMTRSRTSARLASRTKTGI